MKKTNVTIKDDRMTIMAPNAKTPSVMSIDMDKVRKGQFGVVENKAGESVLEFKPDGRKTGDVVALYTNPADAGQALQSIFKSLGGKAKSNKGIVSLILYLLKIIALTAFVIIVIAVILLFLLQQWAGDLTNNITDNVTDASVSIEVQSGSQALSVGVPIPVDVYVETLE